MLLSYIVLISLEMLSFVLEQSD